MGVALTLIGVPDLVVHPSFVRVVLNYGIVPIRHPQIPIRSGLGKNRCGPGIGTGKNIATVDLLIPCPILDYFCNMYQMSGRFANIHLISIFFRIISGGIEIGAGGSRIPSPYIYLLQRNGIYRGNFIVPLDKVRIDSPRGHFVQIIIMF